MLKHRNPLATKPWTPGAHTTVPSIDSDIPREVDGKMIEGFLKEIGIKEQRTGGLPNAEYGKSQKTVDSGSREDYTVGER